MTVRRLETYLVNHIERRLQSDVSAVSLSVHAIAGLLRFAMLAMCNAFRSDSQVSAR